MIEILFWLLKKINCWLGLHDPGEPFAFFFAPCKYCGQILVNMDMVNELDKKVGRPNEVTDWIHNMSGEDLGCKKKSVVIAFLKRLQKSSLMQ